MKQRGWIASIAELGLFFGILTTPLFMDRLGRKNSMILYAIPQTLCWIMIVFGNNFEIFCAARFIGGFGYASCYTFSTVYLGEILEKNLRAKLTVYVFVSYDIGIFIVNLMGIYLSYNTMNLILCLLSILYFFSLFFLPESPYFYFMKNQEEEGLKSLMRFRGLKKQESVKEEVQEIRELTCQMKATSNIKLLEIFKSRSNRRAFVIVICAYYTSVLSGNTVMVTYTQEIFRYSGFSLSASNSAALLTAVIIFSGLVATQLIDRAGRRIFFLFSGILTGTSLIAVGLFFFLKYQTEINISNFTSMPLIGLIIYAIGYSIGLGKIPYILMGELFPMNVKNIAVSFGNLLCPFLTFLTDLIFPFLNDNVGIFSPFWLFAFCSFLGTFIFFYIAPETKGKSLSEIQMILKTK